MVNTCSVPHCNTNYKNGPRFKVYCFPTDPEIRLKWTNAIKREEFTPSTNSRVCELHFKGTDFVSNAAAVDPKSGQIIEAPLKIRRLRPGAIPSQFPNLPHYFSTPSTSRESPDSKRARTEEKCIAQALKESVLSKDSYDQARTFHSLKELCESSHFIDQSWTIIKQPASVIIIYVLPQPAPKIKYSVIIDCNLNVTAFNEDLEINKLGKFSFPCSVNNINDINEILCYFLKLNSEKIDNENPVVIGVINALHSLKNFSVNSDTLNFLIEQISILFCNKHAIRYSSETLIFATLLHTIAPQAYRFIKKSNVLNLPHQNTIKRLCSSFDINPSKELSNNDFFHYIRKKISLLQDSDKLVTLMVDEIHLKEYVDYKGGNIVGMSFDATSCTSSAHVFMIKSILSKYKDVVHILPVKTFSGEKLHAVLKKIILALETVGFNVLCVITDNNSINRKAMSLFVSPPKLNFVYPHPSGGSKPLFFLIDSVHLLKCIRNNWLNQKNSDQGFYYPNFHEGFDIKAPQNFKTASWKTLKVLHDKEWDSLIKYGYKLNFKALAPSNLERQNVTLVIQVFNEFVAQALIELGSKYELNHYQDTADFITIVLTWWQIFNVKSENKGTRLNNKYQTPLRFHESDDKMIFLHQILYWLEEWEKMGSNTGILTKETHSALKLTVDGMIQISRHCLEKLKIESILPGKFQTDDLESRFGFYRQLAGSHYNISLQQLFECEKKLRLQSVLKLKIHPKVFGEIELKDFSVESDCVNTDKVDTMSEVSVESSDISNAEPYLPVIIYLAGYCLYSVFKKRSCSDCEDIYLLDKNLDLNVSYDFLKNLDRGKLKFPREYIVNVVLYTYIVVDKIVTQYQLKFLQMQNHRKIATATTVALLEDNMLMKDEFCEKLHSCETVIKKVVWVTVNILLNNFCKKMNEDTLLSNQSKKQTKQKGKRKLATLKKS